MVAALLACAMLVMKLRPRCALARYLHALLVERPLAWSARVERRRVIFAIGLLLLVAAGGDLVMMLGSLDLATAATWDVAVMLDAVIATWSLAAVTRTQAIGDGIAASRPLQRVVARRRRSRRRPAQRASANDDGPAPACAAA